jgi:hypothetical protein
MQTQAGSENLGALQLYLHYDAILRKLLIFCCSFRFRLFHIIFSTAESLLSAGINFALPLLSHLPLFIFVFYYFTTLP